MRTTNRGRLALVLDQVGPWLLVLATSAVTVLFALGYWIVTREFYPHHGLSLAGPPPSPCGFLDAIYFSIVTETTLGANDIQALGAAKVLVSAQVFVGLALGGVIVAKVTSIHGRETRLTAYRLVGDWIEVCKLPSDQLMFSFTTFSMADDTLHCNGENYDSEGNPVGFFRSELIRADGELLKFGYTNRDSSTDHFSEGVVTHRFVEEAAPWWRVPRWIRYQATAKDTDKNATVSWHGVRALPEEVAAFHDTDHSARLEVISNHLLASRPRQSRDA